MNSFAIIKQRLYRTAFFLHIKITKNSLISMNNFNCTNRFIKDRSTILLISNEGNKDVYSFVQAKRNDFN